MIVYLLSTMRISFGNHPITSFRSEPAALPTRQRVIERSLKNTAVLAAIAAFALPSVLFAATAVKKKPVVKPLPAPPALTFGGWLPFWKAPTGAAEVTQHFASLNSFSPFSYEIDPVMGVIDKIGVDFEPWPTLLLNAHAQNVKILPTIANFNSAFLHGLLSDPTRRADHVQDILGTVLLHNYDGIDIDYENKTAETKPYFSKFIIQLSKTLHIEHKLLSCTVEPRTPLSSRFDVARPPVEYANDYAVLNTYCDEVRIMAYDQGNIDLKLNKTKGSNGPYLPVADPAWVDKVIQEALKTISKKKLVLGIPTYGYVFQTGIAGAAQPAPAGQTQSPTSIDSSLSASNDAQPFADALWTRVTSVTYAEAIQLATSVNATPVRNSAGELSFAYATTSPSTGKDVARIAWFTDAASIAQKIALARKYGLKGVYFFKFDGEADQSFWNLLPSATSTQK